MAGPTSVVPFMITQGPQKQPEGNSGKQFLQLMGPGWTQHTWGHTARSWVEKKRGVGEGVVAQDWGSAFLRVKDEDLGFTDSLFIGKFKT